MTQPNAGAAGERGRRRILHVVYSLVPGGAEHVVATLATQVDTRRFASEVAALTAGGSVAARLGAAGIPVHIVGKRRGFDPRAALRLRRLINERDYDVVHTHNAPANLWTILACPFRRRPVIVSTLHSPARGVYGRFQQAARNVVARRNAVIVGVSRMVTESYRGIDPFNARRYRTLYNGITPLDRGSAEEQSRLRAALGLPADALLAGTVGNLRPPKAHGDLLEAMARLGPRHARLQLIVAGEGELRDALVRRTAELGLERRVHWLGDRSDIGTLLATLDLFVLSSRREGLPLALLEAIAADVPVISTDVGGISEVIEDGVSGSLVPPRDPAALAAALEACLDDPDAARVRAGRARRCFEDRFTAAGMVRSVERLYDEVAPGSTVSGPGDRGRLRRPSDT